MLQNISFKRGPNDRAFMATFRGNQDGAVKLFAASIAQARQRAVEHFRPKRRDQSFLQVIELQEQAPH